MTHLLFLIAGLGLVTIGQQVSLLVLKRFEGDSLKHWVELLAIAMPVSLLLLFDLTMLPVVLTPENDHNTNSDMHRDWIISLIGVAIFVFPLLLTFLFNIFRLTWLYLRTRQNTWKAPANLEALLKGSSSTAEIRLWHSHHSFAFNLLQLWPGTKPKIILSTGMVAQLNEEELKAVLWHETAHLAHRDFLIIWLVSWWRLAFFYLPVNGRLYSLLKEDQELACDEQVARLGGHSLALALADALLKVWEQTLVRADTRSKIGFRAPGLASQNGTGAEVELTEQRVNRLLNWEKVDISFNTRATVQTRLRTLGFLGGSIGLWLFVLELMHLVMVPLGCAIVITM